MAKISRVWGIDVGQCALKALHCTRQGDQVVADAFDYVEYPKILSQPEADPEQLIREAIEQFLSRNEISREDKVAISVPGQSGLAKFFKPPPVDVKRIPDIVRYEAKQQIPFPLEEVIWDFQKMAGGTEADGFAIDTEVGLFAMKREQVYRFLRPFERAEVELDIVQLSPLAIYNFVGYDLLADGPSVDEFDPDSPPESIVVLSMGTDATDLVITNGFRVWQRSIPLGGSHFTKQLTKELKLTFAKAEHLKRNARQAEDPKTVFQAMRPIFNDMVTEIQRSIGYFQGIDRRAKIRGVVLLGNTVKLPGLQQYVAKNLGYEVIGFEKFHRLSGPSVLSVPAFNDNLLTFPVAYGLCLQGLGLARLSTSLLPREITTQRIIRAKKPWAVASVGALMLACAFNFFFHYRVWSGTREDYKGKTMTWKEAESKSDSTASQSGTYKKTFDDKKAQMNFVAGIGEEVVGAGDRRLMWLELMKAVNTALPWSEGVNPLVYTDFKTLPMEKRKELTIEYMESEYFADLAMWFTPQITKKYYELKRHLEDRGDIKKEQATGAATSSAGAATPAGGDASAAPTDPAATDPAAASVAASGGTEDLGIQGPTGPGWVIEIRGYHYFNADRNNSGATYLRNSLLRNLELGSVELPVDNGRSTMTFTFKELGISFPILVSDSGEPRKVRVPNPDFVGNPAMMGAMSGMYPGGSGDDAGGRMMPGGMMPGGMMPGGSMPGGMMPGGMMPGGMMPGGMMPGGMMPGAGVGAAKEGEKPQEFVPPFFDVQQYSFVVQFCWQQKPLGVRLKERAEKLKAEQEKLAQEQAQAAQAEKAPPEESGAAQPPAGGAAKPSPAPSPTPSPEGSATPAASSPTSPAATSAESAPSTPPASNPSSNTPPAATGPATPSGSAGPVTKQ